ncbi:hypothetical protein NP233_g7612 [Leucocoprinus birnbaumii]|uniref:UreD-domain-containing protein n=1 Tax=Leucocoprinus birnbaumii TaxID=56174 RepID=A0AAD5YSL5_9AGAR|nr:hypothetical protein NP233_g7612 [Leucocoprinus birnbaumii]
MFSGLPPSKTLSPSEIRKVGFGGGRITVGVHGTKATFEELFAAYPLKLLSPRAYERAVAIVYLLSYGGGLVAGDRVELDVELKDGCKLLVLSQGSTKVFKTRPGQRLASIKNFIEKATTSSDDSLTTQRIRYTVHPKSCLFLLPDPVTCFRSASYDQIQTFHIAPDASVVILDWLTSGRKALDEEWVFTRYYSENEVYIGGKRWVRDVMLLEADAEGHSNDMSLGPLPRRSLGERLSPYSCYAMVILYGSQVQTIIDNLRARFEAITVFKRRVPEDLLWSFSPIGVPGLEGSAGAAAKGAVVRVAGKETEQVKGWLKEALRGLEGAVGVDVYRRAFRHRPISESPKVRFLVAYYRLTLSVLGLRKNAYYGLGLRLSEAYHPANSASIGPMRVDSGNRTFDVGMHDTIIGFFSGGLRSHWLDISS